MASLQMIFRRKDEKIRSRVGTIFFMGYIQGERRSQGTLFPTVLDDLVPTDHICRVIEGFVDRLCMNVLGFERSEAAELMRGLSGARVEIGLATMPYNLKRITNVLGATKVSEALRRA